MLSRREMLLASASAGLLTIRPSVARAGQQSARPAGRMTLAMHQNTSARAGFRGSLEGWAKAGITQVELASNLVDAFVKAESLPAARRLLSDLGLTAVSASVGAGGLIEPNPKRAAALDDLKRRCEMFATLGLPRVYSTTATAIKPTADDYKAAAANVREAGEVARGFELTLMWEFVRQSTFAATLTTLLPIVRAAAHPNVGILFDFYHFWSGHNRLEDLEALRPGDIRHVHFQDVPDMPRELLDTTTRVVPGDGVSPIAAILRKLQDVGYTGALSVELFAARFQEGDPFTVAREIKEKAEAVMRKAGVL